VALLLFNVVNIPLKYYGIELGYTQGMRFMEQLRGGLMDKISKGAILMGLMVMGTALMNTVSLRTPIAINLGEDVMPIQPAIDAIMPGLLTVLVTLLVLSGLRKRMSPLVIMGLIFLFSIVLHALGIL
jgi:mannose/fructose/N-acetylgalactosamine-specific phosphotransferase system component IID